jgi:hypothetical protein
MAASTEKIYQLKISLIGTHPPVWRRVQVRSDVSLGTLHSVIQAAMGWGNCHLHAFRVGGVTYGVPEPELQMKSETRMKLRQAAPTVKSRFRYEYDFGDDWQHDVLLEKILPPGPDEHYPICIKGKGRCPPEDSGGVWGYAELLETLADPESEEREDMMEWAGGDIDPQAFNLDEVNRRLAYLH